MIDRVLLKTTVTNNSSSFGEIPISDTLKIFQNFKQNVKNIFC